MCNYNELSQLMGLHPQLTVFRRFTHLASRVILSLQADLLEHERDIDVLDREMIRDPEFKAETCSWNSSTEATKSGSKSLRLELMLETQEKLMVYYNFVHAAETMLKKKDPDKCDLDFLQDWMQDQRGGDNFLRRHNAAEGTAWDSVRPSDYMTLSYRTDRLAAWLSDNALPLYHKLLGHKIHKSRALSESCPYPIWDYDERWFSTICSVACMVLSTLLPCLSVVVLYLVHKMLARLLLMVVFSCLFSLVLSLVSTRRRYEVFAATTAFAAVQVVFITGTDHGSHD